MPALAGANLIYGMGMLEMGMTMGLGQLVMDDDIVAMVKRVVSGVDVDDEGMGVDLIHQVGIGGNFLTQRHSLKHLAREQAQAKIIDRRMRGAWQKKGSRHLTDSANERARKLLAEHKPKPLADGLAEELQRIIEQAEKAG